MKSKTENIVIVILWVLLSAILVIPFIVWGYDWLSIVYIILIPSTVLLSAGLLLVLINKIVNYRNDIQGLKYNREKEQDLKNLIYKDLKVENVPYEIQSAEYDKRRLLHDKKLLVESMMTSLSMRQSIINKYTIEVEHLKQTLKELEGEETK